MFHKQTTDFVDALERELRAAQDDLVVREDRTQALADLHYLATVEWRARGQVPLTLDDLMLSVKDEKRRAEIRALLKRVVESKLPWVTTQEGDRGR